MSQQHLPNAQVEGSDSLSERDRLVMGHVEVVKSIAHRLARRLPSSVETNDLIGIGMLGLIDAAGRYQSSQGVPFDAFARRRVMGAMLDELRALDWAPRSVRRNSRELEKTIAQLRLQARKEPSEAEIADALGVTKEDYLRLLDQVRGLELGPVQESEVTDERGEALLAVSVGDEERPDLQFERTELRNLLAQAIAGLPERERHIMALYYEEDLTLAEIGAVIGVSESRVSQLRSLAVARMRAHIRDVYGQFVKEVKRA